MKRLLCFLLALCGVPLVWALGRAFLEGLALGVVRGDGWTSGTLGFLIGAVAMLVLYACKRRALDAPYTFAHEMTHLVVGLCCLAKVHRVHIEARSGYVQLSKENVFITLSPYCVPFYLLVAVCIYGVLRCFIAEPLPFWLWSGLFGGLTTFHIVKTIDALLGTSQPDTHVYGRFFSYWFILCMNLLFAQVALCLVHLVAWETQAGTLLDATRESYMYVIDAVWDRFR